MLITICDKIAKDVKENNYPRFKDLGNLKKCSETSIQFRKEGNALYGKNNHFIWNVHMQVLSFYTRSIAFAPDNSEELALGFGNRSALLYHIQKYEQCIDDIERALSISNSENLKIKLTARKASCLRLIDESKSDLEQVVENDVTKKLKLPTVTPSKQVQGMAESVSLKHNKLWGNHLVANRCIDAGEIIAIEEAYVSFPFTNKTYVVCSHCLSQVLNGIPCNSCAGAIYCSKDCQNEAWHQYHDIECSTFCNSNIRGTIPLFDICFFKCRATIRYFIKLLKKFSLKDIQKVMKTNSKILNGTFSHNQFQSFYNLPDETSKNSSDGYFDAFVKTVVVEMSDFIKKHFYNSKQHKSAFKNEQEMFALANQLLTKCLHTIDSSSFTFEAGVHSCRNNSNGNGCDVGNRSVNCEQRGLVFFLASSFLNHSCMPNVDFVWVERQKVMLYANRPIRDNEQLFITYEPEFIQDKIKELRRDTLHRQFHFSCYCQVCSENWVIPPDMNHMMSDTLVQAAYGTVLVENFEFCKKEKLPPFPNKKFLKDKEKNTKQRMNLIKLIWKHFDDYEAAVQSEPFQREVYRTIWKFYGIEWDMLRECGKTMKNLS